ncbi:MAG: hydroxymethylbilane synthase [Pseudomonadota bacterium]
MTTHTIRIATRKSDLALWQANHVAALLEQQSDVVTVELVPMVTKGDVILDRALNKVGGKGLFIKELEHAMLEERADIAVHSMKDVPAVMPQGFALPCVLERADPRDALVGSRLDDIPEGAVVGTSSLRRSSQLKRLRPDLDIQPLRGNVNTRLAKLDAGEYAAIVLACAGLNRLGMSDRIAEPLEPTTMLPAVGQGIVGIECRDDRPALIELLQRLQDDSSAACIAAERQVAVALDANCHSPLGVHATRDGDNLHLEALVTSPDGAQAIAQSASGHVAAAKALGDEVAKAMLERGAAAIITGAA